MLPKANHRQMIQFVQDEFVDVQSQYEDLLYDYTILKEKVEWGMLPYVQAMLLARYLRGDLDGYPVFLWK